MKIQSHRDVEVWRAGIALVKDVYSATRMMPKEELFALTSQIRRAVVSIPANIAKGSGRQHTKELVQFLHTSRGSLRELDTLLVVAAEVYNLPGITELGEQMEAIGRMLNALIKSLECAQKTRK